jgi:heptosyltransferase-1
MRVLLVRLSALGDIVHAWPLAEALRAARPDMHLSWVVEEPLQPLVEGHPAVDAVIPVATRRWRRRPWSAVTRAEIAALRGRFSELQPELAIDAQGVVKSAMVMRWSRAPRRIGLARPWRRERLAGLAYTSTLTGSGRHRHVVATNLELVRAVDGRPPDAPPSPDGGWLLERLAERSHPIATEPPYGVLLPGTGDGRKLLPVATLAAVAGGMAVRGLRVAVAWGPGERERAEAVVAAAGPAAELAPPTDLGQLAQLLGHAGLVVGGDTGPMHLAASFGVPTVGVFTTTDWRRNGPLGRRTAVVSGADVSGGGPSGSARARGRRCPPADEIVAAIGGLLGPQAD